MLVHPGFIKIHNRRRLHVRPGDSFMPVFIQTTKKKIKAFTSAFHNVHELLNIGYGEIIRYELLA